MRSICGKILCKSFKPCRSYCPSLTSFCFFFNVINFFLISPQKLLDRIHWKLIWLFLRYEHQENLSRKNMDMHFYNNRMLLIEPSKLFRLFTASSANTCQFRLKRKKIIQLKILQWCFMVNKLLTVCHNKCISRFKEGNHYNRNFTIH